MPGGGGFACLPHGDVLPYVKYVLHSLVDCILYFLQAGLNHLKSSEGITRSLPRNTRTMFGKDSTSSALKHEIVLTLSSVW